MNEIRKKCVKRWKKSMELHNYNYFSLVYLSKRYKQCSNALFVKAYKQCSNVGIYVKTLQTLQTLHIFESQARVRI